MFNSLGLGSPGRKLPTEAPGLEKQETKKTNNLLKTFTFKPGEQIENIKSWSLTFITTF